MGALAGAASAVVWGISLAIYQPRMEPTGFWIDSSTGQAYPQIASNNTYWPRDIRQLGILLAVAAVILLGRARWPAVVAGLVLGGVWFSADLWLDRLDVAGAANAGWLAASAVVGFAVAAAVGARLSSGPPRPRAARLAATVVAVLAAVTMLVETPWDEPVTDAADVRIENMLTVVKLVLVLAAAAAAVGLASLRAARIGRMSLTIAAAVGAVWALATFATVDLFSAMALAVAGAVGVAAADLAWDRLFGVLMALAIAAFPGVLVFYFGGVIIGQAMTSIAANPPVNAADTDFSFALGGLVLAAYFGAVVEAVRQWPRPATAVRSETGVFSEA